MAGEKFGRNLYFAEWPIALIWLTYVVFLFIGNALKPELIGTVASGVVLGGFSPLQTGFQIVISILFYGIFLTFQFLGKLEIFRQPQDAPSIPAASSSHTHEAQGVPFHVIGLVLAMQPLVLMSKKPAVYVDFGIVQVGAAVALGGFLVAIMILTPEALAAFDAAKENQLQRAVSLCQGSALATIGLTVPAVLTASRIYGLPIELGLDGPEIVILALTLAVSIVTFVGTSGHAPMHCRRLSIWQRS